MSSHGNSSLTSFCRLPGNPEKNGVCQQLFVRENKNIFMETTTTRLHEHMDRQYTHTHAHVYGPMV